MDTHSKAQRSFNMSRIKSRDTTPEMIVRRLLFSMGYRYRVNAKKLPGKPDIVFTRKRKAIFVHGCFWHRHSGCRYTTMPKTNTDFWKNKFERTQERDKENCQSLKAISWDYLIIWECAVKEIKTSSLEKQLYEFLDGNSSKTVKSADN